MKKLIIENQQPHKVTRTYGMNKILVEEEQPHKVIRSKDKVIVRKQDTKTQSFPTIKYTNLTVKKQDTKSETLILN